MSISLQDWVEFALILATAACLSTWIGSVRLHSRRRTQELRSAGVALAAHYEAVSRLVDEAAFPDVYKKGLVYFTEGVSDQEISETFAASFSDKSFPADAEGAVLPEDLARLYRQRPDLASLYQTAILTGLAAVFLRWPRNAKLFQRMSVEFTSDLRKERAAARTLISLSRSRFRRGSGDPISTHAGLGLAG